MGVSNDGTATGRWMQAEQVPPRNQAGWEGMPAYMRSLMPEPTSHQLTG